MAPSTATLVSAMRAESFDDGGREVIVRIAVRERTLHLYPRRAGDTVIFYSADRRHASAEKPRQVRWIVSGLHPGQGVHIAAKLAGQEILPADRYAIEPPNNSIRSGGALRGAGTASEIEWRYGVTLREGDRVLDTLDPTVVIKNDP